MVSMPCLSKRLIHPLASESHPAEFEKLRDRTSPLNLGNEMLEFGVVVTALDVGLDPHAQRHALPVRVALSALDQHCRRQYRPDRNMPLSENDMVVHRNQGPSYLAARA